MYIGWYPLILNMHLSIRKHKIIWKRVEKCFMHQKQVLIGKTINVSTHTYCRSTHRKKSFYKSTYSYYRSVHALHYQSMQLTLDVKPLQVGTCIQQVDAWPIQVDTCILYRLSHDLYRSAHASNSRLMNFTGRLMQRNFPKIHQFFKCFTFLLPPNTHAYKSFIHASFSTKILE